MPSERRVTDDAGVEFVLGPQIAKGAQGSVYRVSGHPEYAIKLLERPSDLDQIAAVRRLPLDDVAVAAPVTLIQEGGTGYLMRLASDMTPIREPYLPREFGPREANAAWYSQTGGLRRRLGIAANLASTLAALHERGLAYVDLNPGNVMVSDDLARTETWLIDTDNLTSRAKPETQLWGFPGYFAPERITRSAPASTLADTYTLAVHVFRMLVLRHPLEGAAADALDGQTVWGDWRNRLPGLIDQGALPYVADPGDETNSLPKRTFANLLFPLVMSGRMRTLAQRTFIEGRLDPAKRPGSARWREVLYSALDNVVDCGVGCGWTYFRLEATCPSCGAPNEARAVITVYSAAEEQPLSARDSFVASRDSDTQVTARHLWGRFDQPDPVVTVRPVRGGFEIHPHDEAQVFDRVGKSVPVAQLPKPAVDKVYRVRLQVPGRPSRFLAVRSVRPA